MPLPEHIALHPDIRFRAVPPEGVLVDQRNAEVLVVNDLGLRVVQLLEAGGTRDSIIETLLQEYDATAAVIASDVEAFLLDLQARDLLAAGTD